MPQVTLLNVVGLVISSYITIPIPDEDITNKTNIQNDINNARSFSEIVVASTYSSYINAKGLM